MMHVNPVPQSASALHAAPSFVEPGGAPPEPPVPVVVVLLVVELVDAPPAPAVPVPVLVLVAFVPAPPSVAGPPVLLLPHPNPCTKQAPKNMKQIPAHRLVDIISLLLTAALSWCPAQTRT